MESSKEKLEQTTHDVIEKVDDLSKESGLPRLDINKEEPTKLFEPTKEEPWVCVYPVSMMRPPRKDCAFGETAPQLETETPKVESAASPPEEHEVEKPAPSEIIDYKEPSPRVCVYPTSMMHRPKFDCAFGKTAPPLETEAPTVESAASPADEHETEKSAPSEIDVKEPTPIICVCPMPPRPILACAFSKILPEDNEKLKKSG